jgi:NADPH:quinone reductase-like Zn-dependent oxidoreductase
MLDIAGSRPFSHCTRTLTRDATIVIVGGKMSVRGLGPIPHTLATRIASIGRSQRVTLFLARIEKDDLRLLQELLASGNVKPVIDRRYELSRVADALRYLGEGHARGKVVLTV